jgi:hypothetical protein
LGKKINEEKNSDILDGDSSRGLVDFEFSEIHENNAIEKMRECALLVCIYLYIGIYMSSNVLL